MADTSKDGHSTPHERVAAVKRDQRRGPHTDAVADMLAQSLAYASRQGHTRELVADRVDIKLRTLKAYCEQGGASRIHCDTLIRMVRDRGILGDEARGYLVHEMVREMGMRMIAVDAAGDDSPVSSQFLDISKWVGEVAYRINEAGDELDDAERNSIAEAIREGMRQMGELLATVNGGGS